MDEIKKQLEALFEDMLTDVKAFRRKTYTGIFEKKSAQYEPLLTQIETVCQEAGEENVEAVIEELAHVIPAYAYEKMQTLSKGKKDRVSVDYNMNMAVYVIPILNYPNTTNCVEVAKRTVKIWNKKGVTNLPLSYSTYQDISGGFRTSLCYITTAVCENMKKPDDCYELETLRNYRDTYLMETEEGRSLVEDYYETAPGLVLIMGMQKEKDEIYDRLYHTYLMPCIHMIEAGENEACKRHYMEMVNGLKEQYFCS